MIDKKASVMHWIVFGVLAGLAVFFMFSKFSNVGIEVKGEWQTNFLTQNYLPAQQIILGNDAIAKNIGSEIALSLAKEGGYHGSIKSPCGQVEKVNLWNKENQWCFPEVNESVITLAEAELTKRNPNHTFLEITYRGNIFSGKSDLQSVSSEVGTYIFNPSFVVDLGYSFEEYEQLESDTLGLVLACRQENDLSSCVENGKEQYWNYGSCGDEESFSEDERKVVFCVTSPNLAAVSVGENEIQEKVIVKYVLALDFTPVEALSVENVEVSPTTMGEEVSFDREGSVENYVLYYTNWGEVQNNLPGDLHSVFSSMPRAEEFGFFYRSVSFSNPVSENCPVEKQAGVVYQCGGKVWYIFHDETLPSGNYLLTIAAVKSGSESLLTEFLAFTIE